MLCKALANGACSKKACKSLRESGSARTCMMPGKYVARMSNPLTMAVCANDLISALENGLDEYRLLTMDIAGMQSV